MASAGSLIFEIAADISRLRQDLKQANGDIKAALESIRKSTTAEAVMHGAEYAMEFARGFAEKIQAAIDQGDAMGKLAQRIGTTTEALSGLSYAAGFADVSTEDLTTGFKALNKAMVDARDPANDSAVAIKALGLDVKTLQAADPVQAFTQIAEAFSKFQDGAEKAAVATQLFGKQGQALIPLLNSGADGIRQATDEAERMGLIVSQQTADAMNELNDNITRLGKVSEGSAAIVAQELAPALIGLSQAMIDGQKEGGGMRAVLEWLGKDLAALVVNFTYAAGVVGNFFKEAQSAIGAVKKFMSGDISGGKQAWADSVADSQKRMTQLDFNIQQTRSKMSDGYREMAAAWAQADKNSGSATQATLKYSAGLDQMAESQKKAKKAVDDYAQMLGSLQDQYRKLTAEGDPMKELMTDPKYLKMNQQQQATLRDVVQQIKDKTVALDAQKQATENAQSADDFAYKTAAANLKQQYDQIDALFAFGDAQARAVDPTIQYTDTITDLNKALAAGAIDQAHYSLAVKKAADDLKNAQDKTDPWLKQLQAIKDAVDAFGKKSSDAFVDFIFSTKDASVSFSEMVTSILKDMAKMLMYQNVFQPLMKIVGAGVTGGGWDFSSFLSAPGRMAGGPVSAGMLYQVNELPGRKEFFIPNVGGRIATDAGAPSGPNVQVNVNMYGQRDDRTTTDTKADERNAAELGKRISMVVRQVISTEKRTGGLLSS
jgi:hypothetical protein